MKTAILHLFFGFITLMGLSCSPQELPTEPQPLTTQQRYKVPPQLIGEYVEHTSQPKTGKEQIVITITADQVTVKNRFELNLADYTIFVNGDCWMIVYLSPTVELRFSDYIAEQNFIVVTLWENGERIEELGVFDKVIQK
ncbi:hypothetical protein [Flavobacterium beibuense]|uniref:hypothetical protein n=1 Tax=Flavobacterium beibuense TaxID=657326 RepID=UPI003A94A311